MMQMFVRGVLSSVEGMETLIRAGDMNQEGAGREANFTHVLLSDFFFFGVCEVLVTKARLELSVKKLSAHLLPESRRSCETVDGVEDEGERGERSEEHEEKKRTDYGGEK